MNYSESPHPLHPAKRSHQPKRTPPVSLTGRNHPHLTLVSSVKTHVQALTSICRLASQRLSEHMQDIVRITLSFIENAPSHSSSDDHQHDDELVEYCLQAIETYLKRCPKETNQFVPKIVDICIVYLKYDPNFNYEGKRRVAERRPPTRIRCCLSEDDNDMSDDQNGGQSDDDDADDNKGTVHAIHRRSDSHMFLRSRLLFRRRRSLVEGSSCGSQVHRSHCRYAA